MNPEPALFQRPVAEGICLYDNAKEYSVFVIEQNYDYFHSMYESDGMLDDTEKPQLNAEGKVYYLFFGPLPAKRPYAVSELGGGFMSADDAKKWAADNLPYFRRWHA
jgi:hypothetical protein